MGKCCGVHLQQKYWILHLWRSFCSFESSVELQWGPGVSQRSQVIRTHIFITANSKVPSIQRSMGSNIVSKTDFARIRLINTLFRARFTSVRCEIEEKISETLGRGYGLCWGAFWTDSKSPKKKLCFFHPWNLVERYR